MFALSENCIFVIDILIKVEIKSIIRNKHFPHIERMQFGLFHFMDLCRHG